MDINAVVPVDLCVNQVSICDCFSSLSYQFKLIAFNVAWVLAFGCSGRLSGIALDVTVLFIFTMNGLIEISHVTRL